MATPAQIANDMSAQAVYWHKRDDRIAALCRDAAAMINNLRARLVIDRLWAERTSA